uniref:Uncharacterized protein n=1 Tax=Megaselia scalaris TaxID=36166 RepID=T1GDB5_MEGSC
MKYALSSSTDFNRLFSTQRRSPTIEEVRSAMQRLKNNKNLSHSWLYLTLYLSLKNFKTSIFILPNRNNSGWGNKIPIAYQNQAAKSQSPLQKTFDYEKWKHASDHEEGHTRISTRNDHELRDTDLFLEPSTDQGRDVSSKQSLYTTTAISRFYRR